MNISSIVIKCHPDYLHDVKHALENSGLCDIYHYDELGRIVIVLEGTTTEDESQKLRTIQTIPHVLSAEVVYAYSETEFSANDEQFERVNSSLLDSLNQETPAEEIIYHGHLKDK